MSALLSAPWYFLAGFVAFGGGLLACAAYALGCAIGDYLHRFDMRRESELLNPADFCADDDRDPTKE